MNSKRQPTVAVSYSWKTEKKGPYTQAVEEFCALLKKRGITVIRDKGAIPFGGAFIDFMVRLNEHDRVAVFLSKAYLESPNCTFELVTLWEKCGRNESEFFKKVRVWIMSEERFRLDSTAINGHRKYWEDRAKDLAGEVKEEINAERDASALNKEMEDVRRIAGALPDLLRRIAGRLSPLSAKDYSVWIASEFPSDGEPVRKTKEVPPPDRNRSSKPLKSVPASEVAVPPLEQVFPGICRIVDETLKDSPAVALFLKDSFADVLEFDSSSFRLRKLPVPQRSLYAKAIQNLARQVRRRSRVEVDARGLAEVVGGVAVLTLDPAWVLARRPAYQKDPIKVPGREQRLSLADGQTADFIHLVIQGLIDGAAQLKTIFEAGSVRRIQKPIADSLRGVGEAGRIPAIQRYVIGATRPSTMNAAKLEGDQLKKEFKDSQAVLERARTIELDPYSCSEPDTVRTLAAYREQLGLKDLVLILPAGLDSEGDIVEDHINLMSDLKLIFECLKPHLP